MVFNMTGNGGGLNFKVVQYTTTPTGTAAENTIGVVTNTAITSWVMQAEQPTGAEGMVWIEVAVASDVAFYADKKQQVKLYPKSVKQYVGGAWSNMDAYVYQGGWVLFSQAVFLAYDYGSESVAWTVGTNTTKGASSIDYSGNISGATGTYRALAYTTEPIDVTDIKTINFLCDLALSGSWNGYKYFGVRANTTPDGKDTVMVTVDSSGSANGAGKTISLDVSELSGNYYIMVSAQTLNGGTGAGTFNIYKVWGEYMGDEIVFLYNLGLEESDITGSWKYSGSYTKNSDSVSMGYAWNVGRMHTNNLVDLTGYTKLRVRHTTTNGTKYGGIGITDSKSNAETIGTASTSSTYISNALSSYVTFESGTNTLAELDISEITGSYYVVAVSGNNGNSSSKTIIHKIWLE